MFSNFAAGGKVFYKCILFINILAYWTIRHFFHLLSEFFL